MFSPSMLSMTYLSQLGLFLGIGLILYGWIEKRDKLILAGHLAFLMIGLLALWILLTGQISVPDTPGIISKQARTLAFFKGLGWFSLFNALSLLLKLLKLRIHKASLYVLLFFALMLFFMVFNLLQMPV